MDQAKIEESLRVVLRSLLTLSQHVVGREVEENELSEHSKLDVLVVRMVKVVYAKKRLTASRNDEGTIFYFLTQEGADKWT